MSNKRKVLGAIIEGFCVLHDKDVTPNLQEIYFVALDGLTVEEIKRAANILTKTARFFPKPVDFIEAIHGTQKDRELAIEGMAIRQWDTITADLDIYTSVQLEDGAAAAALRAVGGWIELCNIPGDKLVWAKREFIQTYKAYYGRAKNKPVKFLGLIEKDNLEKGYAVCGNFIQSGTGKELPLPPECFPLREIGKETPMVKNGKPGIKQLKGADHGETYSRA